ncbi:hypothetical protein [Streptosporangium sp. CA-115845]|uniref:hypothetical protein n=1 Tax=Streptosporangium sp. CA-115845 TaxID=3240071 RepID=UPI003D90966F
MESIIPRIPRPRTAADDLDASSLAYALSRMTPELTVLSLPGESWADMMARRAAAADILDDLLAEADDLLAAELDAEAVAW